MENQKPALDTYGENLRICLYCKDEFIAHHGLQQYCQSKNGKANYCKQKQKSYVDQEKLAERVIELDRVGMKVNEDSILDINIQILHRVMGNEYEKKVSSDILEHMGYQLPFCTSRVEIENTGGYLIVVGNFTLEWIGKNESILIFKIKKS